MSDPATASGHAWLLTGVSRTLRSGVRLDLPWESVPVAQLELLQRVAEEPGLGVSEPAERRHLARDTVGSPVQQTATAGLLQRRPHGSDRRAVLLRLTDRGRDRLLAWQDANERRVRSPLEALPAQDREAIGHGLPALRSLPEPREAEAGIPSNPVQAGVER